MLFFLDEGLVCMPWTLTDFNTQSRTASHMKTSDSQVWSSQTSSSFTGAEVNGNIVIIPQGLQNMYTPSSSHTYTHAHMHARTHTHTHTHTRARMHRGIHTCTHPQTHTRVLSLSLSHTHTHTLAICCTYNIYLQTDRYKRGHTGRNQSHSLVISNKFWINRFFWVIKPHTTHS